MKRYIPFILLLLICNAASAQFTVTVNWPAGSNADNADTVYYDSNRKLNWKDFKGRPDHNSMAAAITESGFGYKMSMQSTNGRASLVITVFCYFNRKKSWVKGAMDTEYALTHEQHHFDITYINTSLFVQKLRAAKFTSGNYADLVDSIYDECYQALQTMQDQYDGQTSNGRIKNVQASWNKKIDQLLVEPVINLQ